MDRRQHAWLACVLLASTALLAAAPLRAGAQSGVQTSPDGKQVLVSKDVAGERWAIAYSTAERTVTGNVFSPGGGAPQFVWCERVPDALPDAAGDLTFACSGADACLASPCLASSWRFIAKVALPASFFAPPAARYAVGFRRLPLARDSSTLGAGVRILDTFVWYPAPADATGAVAFGGIEGAPLAPGAPFPLLLFSHGSCSFPGASSFLTTALAARGFVVVAPTHPGNSFAEYPRCADDGAVLDAFLNRAGDVEYVLDRVLELSADAGDALAGAIDASRIGMSGWSFGGQTTLQVTARDARVRAGLALAPAGVEFAAADLPAIHAPLMVIGSELDSLAPFAQQSEPAFAALRAPRYLVELLDTGHFAYADICSPGLEPIRDFPDCAPGTLGQEQAHALVLRFALPFAARYVAGDQSAGAQLAPDAAPPGVVYVADPG